MTHYYDDGQARFYHGDVLDVLAQLPAASVQTVVTSPPYWGLRDYGQAGQLGLEATPEEYVERMVTVFREVRRVLADDGTVWLNLGDSYAANRPYQVTDSKHVDVGNTRASSVPPGLKPKDLVGIPWRVAFALQADGWYLRSDIIWAKPNPMPESVTDRPTKAHEYVFLLSKRERYYWDADAVREAHTTLTDPKYASISKTVIPWQERPNNGEGHKQGFGHMGFTEGGRNTRTVWTIATEPYPDAHFAVFPSELPRRCILAGSREGDTVLDPFLGSGTTAMVAKSLGRKAIGIDLSETYLDLAVRRCRQLGLFTSEAAG